MTTKPKTYQPKPEADRFKLSAGEQARLAKLGLDTDALSWIEDQATLFRRATLETAATATPAEVRASLDLGADRIQSVLDWLLTIDSETMDTFTRAAFHYSAKPIGGMVKEMRAILDVVEMARRSTGRETPGNIKKSFKGDLARVIRGRFDDKTAYEVLRALLPDDKKDSLTKLLRGKN